MSVCPKGHDSASNDYCDECGSPMPDSAVPAPAANGAACPECGVERESGAKFCEVCQYDFQHGTGGASASRVARSDALARQGLASLSVLPAQVADPCTLSPETATASSPAAPPHASRHQGPGVFFQAPLLARIHADSSLSPDADSLSTFPAEGIPDRIFHLDLDENMVGRESASKNAHPEIPLRDPGASRRHLKIARIQGSFHALELGSSNGTLLDGVALEPGVPVPLREGSVLRVGIWTTICIQAR